MAAEAPQGAEIVVAPNLRLMLTPPPFEPPGEALRVIFVGRIVPIKGLDFALEALARVRAPVAFEIFGPPEDEATYAHCRALAATAAAAYRRAMARRGEQRGDRRARSRRSDLFLLPTGGENFGHAIFEALSCGVPALISDQTPWRGLAAQRAGWDLPLDAPERFRRRDGDLRRARPAERARRGARARAPARAPMSKHSGARGGERAADPAGDRAPA